MSNYGPWSVKGIDQRAREAAREAAREEGLTIGEYINRMLLEETQDEVPSIRDRQSPRYPRAYDLAARHEATSSGSSGGTFDQLIARLEAVEARSTLALTGIDQSIVGLVTRLNRTDAKTDRVSENVETLIEDLQTTHETLQEKVRALEEDDTGARNLETLKSLEQAIGKLARHISRQEGQRQHETAALKGEIEDHVDKGLSDAHARFEEHIARVESRSEDTARELSGRVEDVESKVSSRLSRIDQFNSRIEAVEGDVAGALTSMESVMSRMQDRLHQAETATNSALAGLEKTFERLDQRIDSIAEHASPEAAAELREQFESRFEGLAAELRASVESSREELAREIEQAAAAGTAPEAMHAVETTVDALEKRISASEERNDRAMESMTEQIGRISNAFDGRLRNVENSDMSSAVDSVRADMDALSSEVSDRLDQFSTQNGEVIDRVTEQMKALADQFETRIDESEQRSASAIEQVGEQVASVAQRLQARQDRSFEALKTSLDAQRRQQDTRLSDALAGVSDRIDEMQRQSVSAFSPVQKAIASLATRLEALEDFTAPPHAEARHETSPAFETVEAAAPSYEDEDEAVVSREDTESYEPDAGFDDEVFGTDFASDTRAAEAVEASFDEQGFDEDEVLDELSFDDGDEVDEEPFEAGLPVFEEPESQEESAEAADDFHTFDTGLTDEGQEDLDDPLAALSDWDDGRDETRESDIFGDDEYQEPEGSEASASHDHDEETAAPDAPVELEEDIEATDYLSRARLAAMNASSANGNARRGAPMPGASKKKSGRVPLVAAVSVIALATAAAGVLITLRGLQSGDDKPVVQTQDPARAEPTSMAEPAEEVVMDEGPASLAGAAETPVVAENMDEPAGAELGEADEAALEAELFDAEPTTAELADPAIDYAALPTIPQAPTLETAADDGNAVAQLLLGEQRLEAGDYTTGPSLVRRAAEAGEPAAQYRLAKLHEKGLGVPKDLAMARQWTERAAEGGNVKAMHDLAVYYAEGESGPQSYAASVEWFRKAADFGLTDSQYNLAVLYEAGLGISPSQTEALYWYEVAARQGDEGAPAKVEALREKVSLDAAQQAQRRAAAWTAATPEPQPNGQYGPNAWQDNRRAQISAIQTVLAAIGYEPGPADGILGSGTAEAIKAYKADTGLEADATITPGLVDSLNETVEAAAAG